MIHINIDGHELTGNAGQTILDIARGAGIEIPTLCHDERVKAYGACGICVVEAEGMPRLLRACSTEASNGMIIKTNTPRVLKNRKACLELLLSDHTGDCLPPCTKACPGKTDCQGYVGLIANGEYEEAVKLIKDKIPLPSSIGRVCPHPCEEACRRQLVEEPISIASLKYFAGDLALQNPFLEDVKPSTGKTVAVVGGGPGGLSAAYFLRREGHHVTVFDAMPKMGGMIRYGIPEYRLPKNIVDDEVELIEGIGVTMKNNIRLGRDITLSHLQNSYDAVILAVGAWSSSKMGIPGEELATGGINFLQEAALGNSIAMGKRVAVVGGGNTAMDACRTAVRPGADEVYNIYRRTRAEMPAEEIELVEAEEEGVIFKYLTNPIDITKDGALKLRLQKMELGQPDASGRRAPVAIPGAEELLEVDTVIMAIGQGLNPAGLEDVELTKRKTISADEFTFRTNLPKVFAIGDATNRGASIAIEAIGEAKRAALVVDGFLYGSDVKYTEPRLVEKTVTAEMFADKEKAARAKMPHLSPEERKGNFKQVNLGFTEEQAKAEAMRCLECGCADYFECKLIDYANQYNAEIKRYEGEKHQRDLDLSNPYLYRNPEKCILCGLCVRVCDEVMGRTAPGLVQRGFDANVQPEMGVCLADSDCISCGQCAALCPVGAIGERLPIDKPVPTTENVTHTTCGNCSVGCQTKVTTKGKMVLRSLPDGGKTSLLCVRGRFGHAEKPKYQRVTQPLMKDAKGNLIPVSFREAYVMINKSLQKIQATGGSVSVSVSDKFTNEEIAAAKQYAEKFGAATYPAGSAGTGGTGGIAKVLGYNASSNKLDELAHTNLILLAAENIMDSHTIAGIRIKQAEENGVKLVDVKGTELLRGILKALTESCPPPKNATGFDELKTQLKDAAVCEDAKKIAELYASAKKAIIVFDENSVSDEEAQLLACMAVVSGHIGKPREGIIVLKPNNNSQGLAAQGLSAFGGTKEGDGALVLFGENPEGFNRGSLEFLAVMDGYLTETAAQADVVLPAALPLESTGTYFTTDRRLQTVTAAVQPPCGISNLEIIAALGEITPGAPVYQTPDAPVLYTDGFPFENGMARLG